MAKANKTKETYVLKVAVACTEETNEVKNEIPLKRAAL